MAKRACWCAVSCHLWEIAASLSHAAASHGAEEEAPPAEEDADRALAELEKVTDGKAKLEGVARLAEQAQPKGSTLDSAGVHTPVSCPAPAQLGSSRRAGPQARRQPREQIPTLRLCGRWHAAARTALCVFTLIVTKLIKQALNVAVLLPVCSG